MLSKKRVEAFQKEILEWYEKNKRDLPWRDAPLMTSHSGSSFRNPYPILVSEVMLQQTQVPRVIPKFLAWMEKFPTIESLAKATTREVLLLWSGLGYNRRALYLKRLAETLIQRHSGKQSAPRIDSGQVITPFMGARMTDSSLFPRMEEELIKLPGIGKYTARAILCFAFNKQIAVVDTNVKKVILVYFFSERARRVEEPSASPASRGSDKSTLGKQIQEIADQLLPVGKAYEWNQALMDYASATLKKEKIPIPRQSPFKKSNRFYRGQVITLLLKNNKETEDSLFGKIENNGISKEEFEKILKNMVKEGLIRAKRDHILIL